MPLDDSGSSPLYDAPDPTSLQLGGAFGADSEIYATGTANNGFNILTQSWMTGTQSVGSKSDAMPSPPSYLRSGFEFAPSVALFGSTYVMWFSGENQDGSPNCLESATSSSPSGPFTVSGAFCDFYYGSGVGDLDPMIWQDPYDGSNWLFLSQQDPTDGISDLAVAELTPDGTAINTDDCMRIVALLSNVNSAVPVAVGGNPQVENPELTYDNSTGGNIVYDLYASYGDYRTVGTYHTVEMACENIIGPCYDGNSVLDDNYLLSGSSYSLTNPAGLSIATNGYNDYALFAAPTSTSASPRGMFFETEGDVTGPLTPLNTTPTQEEPYLPPQPLGPPDGYP